MSKSRKPPKRTTPSGPDAESAFPRWAVWVFLTLAISLVAAIRIRLLDFPLERDEGEYAYAGQLMLQGIPPYELAYNMKLPGVYAAYAAIMAVFGESIRGIHIGLTIVNAATIFLVFLLGRRVGNERVGIVAATAFGFLSVSPGFLGLAAHATHFVLLPAIGGCLVLLHALDRGSRRALFSAGLLFGLAFLMKQQGVFFGIFGGIYLLYSELRTRPKQWNAALIHTMLYSAGAILPFAATCVALYFAGVFDRFWFWIFTYAREYAGSVSLANGLHIFMANFPAYLKPTILIWITAGLGALELVMRWKEWPRSLFIAGFLVFSFLAVCPGFYFRNHYFILMLPAVGILAGLAVNRACSLLSPFHPSLQWMAFSAFAVLVAIGVFRERSILLRLTPTEASIATYGINPFPESLKIAQYIRENSSPDDTVAILGSEPQIPFYADRKLASGFLYTYALMEMQPYALQMQRDMIREVEAANPEFAVFVNIPTSWLPRPTSQKLIFEWFERYASEQFEQVGFVDFLSITKRAYHFDDWETKYSQPTSPYSIQIFKRKDTP